MAPLLLGSKFPFMLYCPDGLSSEDNFFYHFGRQADNALAHKTTERCMTQSATPAALTNRGALMAIGGAEDKMKARRFLTAFLDLAGAAQARIVVIPAASLQAGRVGELYHALFRDLGAAEV